MLRLLSHSRVAVSFPASWPEPGPPDARAYVSSSGPLPLSLLSEPLVPGIRGPARPCSPFFPGTLSFPFAEPHADSYPSRLCLGRLSELSRGATRARATRSLPALASPRQRARAALGFCLCPLTPFTAQQTRQPQAERDLALRLHVDRLLSPKWSWTLSVAAGPAGAGVGRPPGAGLARGLSPPVGCPG